MSSIWVQITHTNQVDPGMESFDIHVSQIYDQSI